jgi:hypothetical protein
MSYLIPFRSHVYCGLLSDCFSGHFHTNISDGLSVALILIVCPQAHWNVLHLSDLCQISFSFNAFHFPAYIFATLNCISPNCPACSMHFLAPLLLLSYYFMYFPCCYHIFCTAWKTEVASSSETLGTVWGPTWEDFNACLTQLWCHTLCWMMWHLFSSHFLSGIKNNEENDY